MMNIILLISLITICTTLSMTPAFKAPDKYIQIGSRFFQFTQLILNQHSVGNNNHYTFTISLSQAKLEPYICHANIQGIDYQINSLQQISFSIKNITNSSNSSLSFRLYTASPNNLLSMSIRYLVVLKPFTQLIYPIQLNLRNVSLVKIEDKWTGVIVTPLPRNQQQQYLYFLNGVTVKLFNSQKIDIAILSFRPKGRPVMISVQLKSVQRPNISQIIVSVLFYDNRRFQNKYDFQYRVTFVTILSINGQTTFYNNSDISMNQKNTFWGLTKLSFSHQSSFTFAIDYQNESIKVGSKIPYNLIEIRAVVIQVRQCDSLTPFYLISTDTCYDQCPDRYRMDTVQNRCEKCLLYDCLGCANANNLCSNCSASGDFRELNTITNRCDPIRGYYDDGNNNSIAKPCSNNCQTCSSTANKCTSCKTAFILNGDSNICEKCPVNCIKCTSRVVCTACKTFFTLRNGQCLALIRYFSNSSNVVASATTTLFSLCALVSIFVFIKQKREWPTVEEKQEKYADDKNGLQRQRKSSSWNLRQQTLRQLPSNKSIKLIPCQNQSINLRAICQVKLDEKQLIK